ncbi:MAG: RNA 2',3'-cyclic phosphodiesterase [Acidobacteriota bacterium]
MSDPSAGGGSAGEDAGSWRLFIALPLPDTVREAIGRAGVSLGRLLPERVCRFVPADSMHLTLRFLGDTDPERVPALCAGLDAAAAGSHPLDLQPARLGTFGGRGGIRVIFLHLTGDLAGTSDLAAAIEKVVMPLGYPAARPFRAHLTLARVRERATRDERRQVGAAVERFDCPAWPSFSADEVALLRSRLLPGGAQHTRVHTASLR